MVNKAIFRMVQGRFYYLNRERIRRINKAKARKLGIVPDHSI